MEFITDTITDTKDVIPKQDVSFVCDLGSNPDGEIAKSFRHSWESQNVDVHSTALVTVMNALSNFKSKLLFNTHTFLKIIDNNIPGYAIETHLADFDILSNKNFDGLQSFRKKASINPKNYAGSPLTVNFRMYNMNYDKYTLVRRLGHFYIKGDGEINYVNTNNVSFSHITAFEVQKLCFKNLNNNTEQVLFEIK